MNADNYTVDPYQGYDESLAAANPTFFSSDTPITVTAVPTSQPDFNVAGSNPDPLAILTAGSQAITSVIGAVAGLQDVQARASINRAVSVAGTAATLKQIQDQGKIQQLQSATQLAQAQQAYNRAAGIVSSISPTTVIVALAVAGVVLTAMTLYRKK